MNKNLRYKLEAAAALLPLGLFKALGLERASRFGGWLLRSLGPRVGVSRRARSNIKRAMPELSDTEVDRIVADMWENIGRTIAEIAHLDKFRAPENAARIDVAGMENVLAHRDRGGMCVSGHFANWELMPLHFSLLGLEGGEVYRHANNPTINKWLLELRQRAILPVQIPKGPKGAKEIVRLIRQKGFVCMLVDQKMNDGIEATLFGMRAMSPQAPATMAVRYGVPIIPVSFVRTEGVHFRQTAFPAIEANPEADRNTEILRITQALNDWLESEIRAHPAQWFWLHNRWPKDAVKT